MIYSPTPKYFHLSSAFSAVFISVYLCSSVASPSVPLWLRGNLDFPV
jgi:hypothetical protein